MYPFLRLITLFVWNLANLEIKAILFLN